ncbi:double-strand break repair protein AddB [Sphingomicrobium flavum]|uniref:double-strand break repair protein AddB n=1 Tax=Sphingomicrobium flavum TaxID=1229164 RepID=UPI0021AE1E45|nr:double-strand break repair protein AddB [Sphingomicrobium flavum]
MARVFTIPAHRSFADALAAGLLRKFGKDELPRGRILLPTNRAVRTVTEAFVRLSGGGLLLPRLVPIGDPELGERMGAALDPAEAALPPAIGPLERQLKLASLLQDGGRSAGEAMRMASELGRTLDMLEVEQVSPSDLRALQAETPELSAHWETMLAELSLLFDRWPAVLQEAGKVDLARRRNQLLHGLAERWKDAPPSGFTVAAGITTTAPAVAALLRRVSQMDEGMVVLPSLALAREMPDAEWEALRPEKGAGQPTHPQCQLRLLLDRMGVARGEVEMWKAGGRGAAPAVRGRAVAHAMASAAFSGKWAELSPPERRLSGVQVMQLPDPSSEAMAIAVALRAAVETPEKTAALVTPDRNLAARVTAILKRWGIEADDSAGRPLSATPVGTLMLSMTDCVAEDFAPVPLVALLKHPLVGGEGSERGDWLAAVRAVDIALRGPRPEGGLKGIERHFNLIERDDEREAALAAWAKVSPPLHALADLFKPASLAGLAASLRQGVDLLAGDNGWRGPAGRQAAELVTSLEEDGAAASLKPIAQEWVAILQELVEAESVRPPYGGHPRIFIWGLLEARLQQADLMILGSLNEGSWPPSPSPDPWLAPKLRSALGLQPLEARIGLAAHDFMSALGAPRVLLTRAERDGRSPTVASRFWLRVQAMTGGLPRALRIERLAKAIDKPDGHAPTPRPRPAPPAAERPKSIYVTAVDRLKADPFAFYAKAMLKLRSLDPLDADHHAAWKGSAVHKVLEDWLKQDKCDPATLRARAEELVRDAAIHPMLRALWQPRLMEAIDWIAAEVENDVARGRQPRLAEAKGECERDGVTLKGLADRIDTGPGDALAVVDYKTGSPPSKSAGDAGFALQLGLLGLIAESGGFEGADGMVEALEYWSLAKRYGQFGYRQPPGKAEAAEFMATTAREFDALAAKYLTGDEPFTAKLHPAYAPYGDYDQLMRLDEWYGRD